mmetsp:Transcript_36706/g.86599  ORF Transcript_36706/g.86599 Transcript_36706/m.86599 type:complete len:397 (-) Transcript_36706:816-2006(-)
MPPSLLLQGCDLRHELLHDGGVGEGGGVAQRVGLVARDLAQHAAHDLARSRLGQARDDHDTVGDGEAADLLAHRHLERGDEVGRLLDALGQDDVGEDALPLDVVRHAHHRRLHAGRVQHEGRLDLGGAQPVAAHVEHVVDAAGDPVVPIGVALAAVAREVLTAVRLEVGLEVARVVAVDRARDARPRLRHAEHTLDPVALEDLARCGVDHHGPHAEHGERRGAGLHRSAAGQVGDHVPAGLSLPEGVDHDTALLAHLLKVPAPGLRVDRLAHRAEHAQRRLVVLLDVLGAKLHERTDGGRCRVEGRDAVALDHVPVAAGVGVGGQPLEHEGSRGVAQRPVDNVRVSRDPPDVGHARVDIPRPVVEGVVVREGRPQQVARRRVQHALGLARRARGVE